MKSLRRFRGTERFGYRKGLQLLSSLNEFAGTVNERGKARGPAEPRQLGSSFISRRSAPASLSMAEAIVQQMRPLQIGSSMTIVKMPLSLVKGPLTRSVRTTLAQRAEYGLYFSDWLQFCVIAPIAPASCVHSESHRQRIGRRIECSSRIDFRFRSYRLRRSFAM